MAKEKEATLKLYIPHKIEATLQLTDSDSFELAHNLLEVLFKRRETFGEVENDLMRKMMEQNNG